MRGLIDDLRYAARRLARAPGFTAAALTILVLGIGVNSSAFSVVNALLLQTPPFRDAERVVTVLQDNDAGVPNSTSYPAYLDMAQSDAFETVSAFQIEVGFLDRDGTLAPVMMEYATSTYLDVIGLSTTRGVWFGAEHDDPVGPPAAVITYRMWQERLAADPDVVGRTLRIEGGSVTVVGVGPADFNGGTGPAMVDLWLSISAMRATGGQAASLERRQDHPFTVRARLADGVTLERAQEAMDLLASDLGARFPDLNAERGIGVFPVTGMGQSPEVDADVVAPAAFTMLVVFLVLVVGTLNLANLLLVRSTARAREIAVRLALGAGRGRVVRVVLAEAAILAAVGGLGGLALAGVSARMLSRARLDFGIPLLLDLRLDTRVVLFTALLTVVTGLVFGLVPALRATRRDVNSTLRDEATDVVGSRRRFTLTSALVSIQIAVSLVLLAVSGVFIQSLLRAGSASTGFDHDRTAYLEVNIAPLELGQAGMIGFFERLDARLEGLPTVRGASAALRLPGAQFGTTTLLLGSGVGRPDRPTETPWNAVRPDYFEVLGIPLLHGRFFTTEDADGPPIAVVSESFARTWYGRTDVVGAQYRSEGNPDEPVEIIGVVGDVPMRALGETPRPHLYWLMDFAAARVNLVAGVTGSTSETMGALRDVVREADARVMVVGSGLMSDYLAATLDRQRLAGLLLMGLGGLALLLATIGIYGVVSFAVSRRRHEVGIRMALGAGGDSVVRLFVAEVAVVVLAGALLGGMLSMPLASFVGAEFAGGAASPLLVPLVAIPLVVAALAATIVPAARAARSDPTSGLRQS